MPEAGERSDGRDDTLFRAYVDHFLVASQQQHDATKTLVAALMTISSGALILSVTFMEKLAASPPRALWLLIGSWACLGITLAAACIAFISMQYGARRYLEQLGDIMKEYGREGLPVENPAEGLVDATNWVGSVSLLLGIALVLVFSSINL